jgi:hypothetical protein
MSLVAFDGQRLAQHKPEFDAGVHAYEKDRFGDGPGFTSAQGLRAGSCVGDVLCRVFIKSAQDLLFPRSCNDDTVTPRAA